MTPLFLILCLGIALVLAGIIICLFFPERIGGSKQGISSLALGLSLVLIGTPLSLFTFELINDYRLRDYYLGKAKYYLLSYKRYIISGGVNKTDNIFVDDDLRVLLNNDKEIFSDQDGVRSDFCGAAYKGTPIVFYSTDVRRLRIMARDVACCTFCLSPLYLHKPDGEIVKLTDGVDGREQQYKPVQNQQRIFFDKTIDLK
jgi:hypothetical protein